MTTLSDGIHKQNRVVGTILIINATPWRPTDAFASSGQVLEERTLLINLACCDQIN